MTDGYPLFVIRRFRAFRALSQRLALLAAAMLVLVGAPVWSAAALEGGDTGAAAATQDGWWNRLQGPQESEPAGNPIRPLVPRLPAPPTVPADAIAVGAVLGQPDKVAAVGIEVALPPGGALDGLTLRLKEAPGNAANLNANMAKVLACPVTAPWGPDKNANWMDRPPGDCELAKAEGVRAGDGAWTFDLTPMGTLWSDPFAPLPQNGVVLSVDPAGSPGPVQVSWLDFDSGNVVVELLASVIPGGLGAEPSAPVDTVAPAPEIPYATPPEAFGPSTTFSDPLAYAGGATSFGFGSPRATVDVPAPDTSAEEQATLVASHRGEAADDKVLRVQPAVGFWEDVPTPTALLLPLALGLAVLIGFVLGPAGRPLPVWPRAGGLSRALARRDAGGRGAQS